MLPALNPGTTLASILSGRSDIAALSLVLAGSIMGFLFFNFRHAPDMEDQAGGVLHCGRCADTDMEGPIDKEQVFAVVIKVQRKGKWIAPGDFWWEFFEHIWLHLIPFRRVLMKLYRIRG